MLMKTQDMGYILQKVQSEKKVNQHYAIVLHFIKRLNAPFIFLGTVVYESPTFAAENWEANC